MYAPGFAALCSLYPRAALIFFSYLLFFNFFFVVNAFGIASIAFLGLVHNFSPLLFLSYLSRTSFPKIFLFVSFDP